MKIYFNSLSASDESVDAFLYILVVTILAINKNDVQEFTKGLQGKMQKASDLLRQHGAHKATVKYFNKFLLTKTLSDTEAVELGKILKTFKTSFTRDVSIDTPHLKLLNACIQSLSTDSVTSWNTIQRDVRVLNDQNLNSVFTTDAVIEVQGLTYVTAAARIKPLIKKLTGNLTSIFLTIDQAKAARTANPEVYSEYSKLLRIINQSVKHEIFTFVRRKQQTLVPIDVVRAHLESLKMPNNLPRGFVGGQVSEDSKFYTAEGRMLDKVPSGLVVMNPNYDPATDSTYVLYDAAKRLIKYRTVTFLANNKKARHSVVREFMQNEEEHKARWRSDLMKKGSEEQVLAAMVELLYTTSARIGGKDNATAGEPTYGLSTLQVAWVKMLPTKIVLDYTGKKLANQYVEYKTNTPISKKVQEIIRAQLYRKTPESLLFTFNRRHLSRQRVSAYLKTLGIQLTPHSFRRITGTKLASSIIAKAPFKASAYPKQAEVEKWFKEAALQIGEALHHRSGNKVTSSTAIKSYIDPQVIEDYFVGLGLRRPKWLPTK